MKLIYLSLITPAGDELGRLQLTAVTMAAAGETSLPGNVLSRRAQFESLLSDLYATLQTNGVQPAQTSTEIELAASLALLEDKEGEVTIPITVKTLPTSPSKSTDTPVATADAIEWDDLLQIIEEPEGTKHV